MSIKEITLNKALAMLRAAGTQYIVVAEDGTEHVHGDLKLAPPTPPEPEKGKRKRRVPVGTYHDLYYPVLKDMKPGEEALVPFGDQDPGCVQAATTAWMSHNWGKGTYATHMSDEGLQVLRFS